MRPRRNRRRNNTGFYYGLRDDDMNFQKSHKSYSSNSPSRSFAAAAANSLWKGDYDMLHRGHEISSGLLDKYTPQGHPRETDDALNPNRLLRNHRTKRQKLMSSISQNVIQSLWSKLQNQQLLRHEMGPIKSNMMASILNRQRILDHPPTVSILQTAVKSKSKQHNSRKKRRKNNTGFYYGIREDVLGKAASERRGTTFSKPSSEAGSKKEQPAMEDMREKTQLKDDASRDDMEQSKQEQQQTDVSQDQSTKIDRSNTPKKILQPPPAKDGAKPKRKNNILGKKNLHTQTANEAKSGIFDETLQELREMKDEVIALREELRSLKGQLHEADVSKEPQVDPRRTDEKSKWWARPSDKGLVEIPEATPKEELAMPIEDEEIDTPKLSPRLRRREFERIGRDVETWACRLLFDQDDKAEDGWKEIECNKFCRKKFNPDGRTQVFLKVRCACASWKHTVKF